MTAVTTSPEAVEAEAVKTADSIREIGTTSFNFTTTPTRSRILREAGAAPAPVRGFIITIETLEALVERIDEVTGAIASNLVGAQLITELRAEASRLLENDEARAEREIDYLFQTADEPMLGSADDLDVNVIERSDTTRLYCQVVLADGGDFVWGYEVRARFQVVDGKPVTLFVVRNDMGSGDKAIYADLDLAIVWVKTAGLREIVAQWNESTSHRRAVARRALELLNIDPDAR